MIVSSSHGSARKVHVSFTLHVLVDELLDLVHDLLVLTQRQVGYGDLTGNARLLVEKRILSGAVSVSLL